MTNSDLTASTDPLVIMEAQQREKSLRRPANPTLDRGAARRPFVRRPGLDDCLVELVDVDTAWF